MTYFESFTRIAPHYDELMRGVPYGMWVNYFELLCDVMDHTPRRVLDVCCGTGTVSEMLAAKGLAVVGVDKSEQMIRFAREKAKACGQRVEYHVQDIAELQLGKRFDTALSFFDSLNYVIEPERLRLGLRRISEHLESGGLFIFDLNTEYAFTNRLFDQQLLDRRARVRYRWTSEYDEATRICEVRMQFWIDDPPESFVELHLQRAHTPDEIRSWLKEAGFDEVRVYHSYSLDRPRPSSDRVHYLARRSG